MVWPNFKLHLSMRCVIECLDGCLIKKKGKTWALGGAKWKLFTFWDAYHRGSCAPPTTTQLCSLQVTTNFAQVQPGNEITNDNHTSNISRCLLWQFPGRHVKIVFMSEDFIQLIINRNMLLDCPLSFSMGIWFNMNYYYIIIYSKHYAIAGVPGHAFAEWYLDIWLMWQYGLHPIFLVTISFIRYIKINTIRWILIMTNIYFSI